MDLSWLPSFHDPSDPLPRNDAENENTSQVNYPDLSFLPAVPLPIDDVRTTEGAPCPDLSLLPTDSVAPESPQLPSQAKSYLDLSFLPFIDLPDNMGDNARNNTKHISHPATGLDLSFLPVSGKDQQEATGKLDLSFLPSPEELQHPTPLDLSFLPALLPVHQSTPRPLDVSFLPAPVQLLQVTTGQPDRSVIPDNLTSTPTRPNAVNSLSTPIRAQAPNFMDPSSDVANDGVVDAHMHCSPPRPSHSRISTTHSTTEDSMVISPPRQQPVKASPTTFAPTPVIKALDLSFLPSIPEHRAHQQPSLPIPPGPAILQPITIPLHSDCGPQGPPPASRKTTVQEPHRTSTPNEVQQPFFNTNVPLPNHPDLVALLNQYVQAGFLPARIMPSWEDISNLDIAYNQLVTTLPSTNSDPQGQGLLMHAASSIQHLSNAGQRLRQVHEAYLQVKIHRCELDAFLKDLQRFGIDVPDIDPPM